MAVTGTLLTSGSSASDPASTASISPGSNRLVLVGVVVAQVAAAIQDQVSVTGNGLTYVQVGTVQAYGTRRGVFVFRALGASPSAGALSIDYTGTETFADLTYSVVEFDGVDTSGTNGSGAVGTPGVNSSASASSLSVTIPGTPVAGDATWAMVSIENDDATLASEAGWTDLSEVASTNTRRHSAVWDADADTSASWSWSGGAGSCAAVGIRVIAAGGGGTSHTHTQNDSLGLVDNATPLATSPVVWSYGVNYGT